MNYNVVFENLISETHKGVRTWTSFKDKKDFDEWYNDKMKSWYKVIAEGFFSSEEAIRICDETELTNTLAFVRSMNVELF